MDIVLRSAPEFAPGSRVLGVDSVKADAIRQQTSALPGGLQFRVPRDRPWIPQAVPPAVVSIEVRGKTLEYMIAGRKESLASEVVFLADPVHVVLHDAGIVDWLSPDGTSQINLGGPEGGMSFRNYWWTFLRPFLRRVGHTWIELGEVDSDARVIHAWEASSAQAVIVALVRQLKREWRFRRDDAGRVYRIDVGRALGQDESTTRAVEGLNLLSLSRIYDRESLATVIRPIGTLQSGAPADISGALWIVTAVDGDDVTVGPHVSVGGPGPVGEPGQWVGAYLESADGSRHRITASTAGSVFSLASGRGSFSPADDVRLVADAQGTGVLRIESPSGISRYGRIERSVSLRFNSRGLAEVASLTVWDAQDVRRIQFTGEGGRAETSSARTFTVRSGSLDGLEVGSTLCVVELNVSSGTDYVIVASVTAIDTGRRQIRLDPGVAEGSEAIALTPGIPAGWSSRQAIGARRPIVLRRPFGGGAGQVTISNGRISAAILSGNVPPGTIIRPGDLFWRRLGSTSQSWWVLKGQDGPSLSDVLIMPREATTGRNVGPEGWTILSPQSGSSSTASAAVCVIARDPTLEIDLPDTALTPAVGSSVFARIKFIAMTALPNVTWAVLPRLSVVEGSTVRASGEASNLPVSNSIGATFERVISLGPIAIGAPGTYKLSFRPGYFRSTSQPQYPVAIYITEALLYVGVAQAGENPNLVAEAAVGIQLGNRELERRREWRARYTCDLLELADHLEVSPALMHTQVGGVLDLDCPTMDLRGRFRIVGVKSNPDGSRSRVTLENVIEPFIRATSGESPLFVLRDDTALQRVSRVPPRSSGIYRAADVSAADLSSGSAIDVREVS